MLTARHVIAPALAGPGGQLLVRPVGVAEWLPARVEWEDADADAALAVIEDESWRAPAGESVLRWGELAGSDPVPCAAVGFPWASARPDRMRDTAHVYGQLAPLGQLRQGRLDLDVASASPSAREGGSPWAGMSGAGVIADSHLVGVITVDPARYQDRLVAVPTGPLLADAGFRARLAAHGVPAEAGAGRGRVVSAAARRADGQPCPGLPAGQPPVPAGRRPRCCARSTGWCRSWAARRCWIRSPAGARTRPGRPVLLVTGGGGSGKTRLGREACVQMLVAGWDAGLADDTAPGRRRHGPAAAADAAGGR